MANSIDELMSKDPLELSAQDIDAIIARQRNARAQSDSGVKPKKGPGKTISLLQLGLVAKAPSFKRRKL